MSAFNERTKMASGFAAWKLLLSLLLVMCAHRSGAREMIEKHKEELIARDYENKQTMQNHQTIDAKQDHGAYEQVRKKDVHAHPSSRMDHMDPSSIVFFTMKDLKVGETMPIYFRYNDPSTSPHLLPREEADSIPFSLKELPYLLQLFSFSHDSPQARAMEDTLRQCEIYPIKEEIKLCPASLESMFDFAHRIFGLETDFKVVSTRRLTKSTTVFQNYTILEVPRAIPARKMVACHTMPYPYKVFYCHSQETENKVFNVSLGGDNGDRVEAVAVCHMDTSKWSHDHASFHVLGMEPGSSHVCHFFQEDNLIFVPVSTLISNVYVM